MKITNQSYKNSIISKAKELGFFACGFAKYEVLEGESNNLRAWLDAGKQADMAWIERGFDKRKDIRQIMPEAKSVISLAFNYYTPFEHDENKPKISRYAWGKDYHKILKKKLKELCEFIALTSPEHLHVPPGRDFENVQGHFLEGEGGKASDIFENSKSQDETSPPTTFLNDDKGIVLRSYVDDGPVMDKVWAQKAGIGWMGKHTNIINPEFGSWFFLSEIITNIDFGNYDTPIEDMCGSCTLCISACPTSAIESEYVVNANKCISYQTIENRGEIPDSINLDGWIFGCDVCQDVCPYNSPKYNHVTEEKGFWPKEVCLPLLKGEWPKAEGVLSTQTSSNPLLNKEGAIELTEEQFVEIFVDSPIKRTKFAGWKRNLERIDG